ncbi:MAG: alpha/beta hydrolase [Saprospiraceae bacterium]|nr:alpha/beta hydrolase [Saprospiraceae bacterium]
MPKTVLPLLLLSLIFTSCQQQALQEQISTLTIHAARPINRIALGDQEINMNEAPPFILAQKLEFSTILRLNIDEEDYELFLEPGKGLEITIGEDSISFQGDLSQENNYLLSEKGISTEVEKYLSDNWYRIHSQSETAFFQVIDSVKGVYLSNMARSTQTISQAFIKVNNASIDYSFDRILLRYPEWHERFTGSKVAPNEALMKRVEAAVDRPEFLTLDTYQKCLRTWFTIKINKQMEVQQDSSTYLGKIQLETTLDFITQQFKSTALRDYWSFQFIKDHLEQYTWINGSEYLQDFISTCQTEAVCQEAKTLEAELLEEREGHEIQVYKTAKDLQLEAHIFKPKNFDPKLSYPVLAAFHGGGWQAGHADWTFGSAEHAAEHGMIGIAIEYRLSNRADITPLEAMEDTRDAIRWIRKHAVSLSIDKNRIVGKGLSAGGHLISSISVVQEDTDGQENSVPNALVLVSPAIDTQDGYFKSLLHEGINASHLSALENLDRGMQIPPTLILQGRTDRVTPTPFAEQYKNKMDALGYDCQLKIYEDCGHIFTPSHLDDTGMPMPDPEISQLALAEQIAFLKARDFIK